MHFESPLTHQSLHQGQNPAMVAGAQRMQPAVGFGDHGVRIADGQAPDQFRRHLRHIAGHDQHPVGIGTLQRRQQAAEWTAIGDQIRDLATDNRHVSKGFANHSSDVFQQRSVVPGQQCLVATHTPAATARQNKPGHVHEMMVPVLGWNKVGIFCLLALAAMLPARAETPASRKLVIRADKRTGKLRTVAIATVRPSYKAPAADIAKMVATAAKANNVDPLLVHSVIQVESNYNPYAVSSSGARGLMQLMPGTAKELGVLNSFDPQQNIEAGVKYLKYLKDLYQDDRLALAAYNAGPGAVQKYKTVPPYPETRDYVQRVGERYEDARKAAGFAPAVALEAAASEQPQAPVVVTTEEKHPRLEQYLDEYGRLHLRTVSD